MTPAQTHVVGWNGVVRGECVGADSQGLCVDVASPDAAPWFGMLDKSISLDWVHCSFQLKRLPHKQEDAQWVFLFSLWSRALNNILEDSGTFLQSVAKKGGLSLSFHPPAWRKWRWKEADTLMQFWIELPTTEWKSWPQKRVTGFRLVFKLNLQQKCGAVC